MLQALERYLYKENNSILQFYDYKLQKLTPCDCVQNCECEGRCSCDSRVEFVRSNLSWNDMLYT